MRDLIGTIMAARRVYEAAIGVRAAAVVGAPGHYDAKLVDEFKQLATAMGFMVEAVDEAEAEPTKIVRPRFNGLPPDAPGAA